MDTKSKKKSYKKTKVKDEQENLNPKELPIIKVAEFSNVEELATFDIEYIFLNIRGKSVGEDVEVLVTCPDDNKAQVPVLVNLDDINIKQTDDHKKDIKLDY